MKTLEIKTKQVKPKPCQLCGRNDGKTQFYVGGVFDWMHPKCAKIAEKAINEYLRFLSGCTVEEVADSIKKAHTQK